MLQELRYMIAISEQGTISGAAEYLKISQPALSLCVKKVESELGVVLFKRINRKYVPTSEGECYIETARNMLKIYDDMTRSLLYLSSDCRGMIRIGFGLARGSEFLPDVLPAFYRRYPEVTVKFAEEHADILEQMLAEDRLDIAIIRTPIYHQELEYEVISTDEPLLAINKNNPVIINSTKTKDSRYPFIDLKYMLNETFIVSTNGPRMRTITNHLINTYHVNIKNVLETKSKATIMSLVMVDYGIGIVSESFRNSYDTGQEVEFFTLGLEGFGSQLSVVHKKGVYIPDYTKKFISLIKDFYGRKDQADTMMGG